MNITTDVIFFDLDGTLFNSKKFAQEVSAMFAKHLHLPLQEINKSLADYIATLESRTDFNPKDYIEYLHTRYPFNKQELLDTFYNTKLLYENSVYPEVYEILRVLSAKKKIGLYSEGNHDLQMHKITNTSIAKYLDPEMVFIFRRKLAEEALQKLPQICTIIDDKPVVVEHLANQHTMILLNRASEDTHAYIPTIHTLNELSG